MLSLDPSQSAEYSKGMEKRHEAQKKEITDRQTFDKNQLKKKTEKKGQIIMKQKEAFLRELNTTSIGMINNISSAIYTTLKISSSSLTSTSLSSVPSASSSSSSSAPPLSSGSKSISSSPVTSSSPSGPPLSSTPKSVSSSPLTSTSQPNPTVKTKPKASAPSAPLSSTPSPSAPPTSSSSNYPSFSDMAAMGGIFDLNWTPPPKEEKPKRKPAVSSAVFTNAGAGAAGGAGATGGAGGVGAAGAAASGGKVVSPRGEPGAGPRLDSSGGSGGGGSGGGGGAAVGAGATKAKANAAAYSNYYSFNSKKLAAGEIPTLPTKEEKK
eukprot:TRINITY_DN1083_c0_g8_i2.p1 TRINITY_DN1083_c0_g8~~TRINITY_DN1083_c0_g8_i2.p1  ORF type:complete len:339 (-),score=162.04 TRINITY_DN1083_c0_g8_i2:129-1100(-)